MDTWTARECAARVNARELSAVEVARHFIARVQQLNPSLNAIVQFDAEAVLVEAQQVEQRLVAGETLPMAGVPVTIKDNIATLGDPTPVGTAASDMTPAQADAPPAARLREAGAVFICNTTMPDYGMLSSGLSTFHKLARNPWDVSKTPGGSSAGAGSAAAAGYGPLHIGTDIGGSLRLPAGWCGIFSLKPSLGRIPIDPPYTGRAAGPMTRTVADAALMMQVLSRPDARDSMRLPYQEIAWDDFDAAPGSLKGLKIGLLLDAGCGLKVAPEVSTAVEQAAKLFEAAGAIVTPMKPFLTPAMLDGLDHAWRMRSYIDLNALAPGKKAAVLPYIRQWAGSAAGMTGQQVFVATSQAHAVRLASVKACSAFDFVISPTAPVPAFAAELPSPTNDPLHGLEHIAFTVPYNMSEQPAASINCGYTAGGLPIGLQIAGQRFDDLGVLRVSRAYELLRSPQRNWPSLPI